VKYILDTHVWIWHFEASSKIPERIQTILKDMDNVPLGVSVISAWEIAKKTAIKKLRLSIPCRDWIVKSSSSPGIEILPITPEIAYEANYLPEEFHRDPADCIIVATARLHDITLITKDHRILAYPHVKTLWD